MAVDVLSHESWHLHGVIDEAETECRSLQTMAWTAQQLGATADQGRAMALAQFNGVYQEMPEQYRSGACADGGALDLHGLLTSWPAVVGIVGEGCGRNGEKAKRCAAQQDAAAGEFNH